MFGFKLFFPDISPLYTLRRAGLIVRVRSFLSYSLLNFDPKEGVPSSITIHLKILKRSTNETRERVVKRIGILLGFAISFRSMFRQNFRLTKENLALHCIFEHFLKVNVSFPICGISRLHWQRRSSHSSTGHHTREPHPGWLRFQVRLACTDGL